MPPGHHSGRVRSKYFKKNEKKACHAFQTSLILTAKPNQTMEKLMIRNVLHTLGSIRSALAVGVGLPFLIAASAYAQDPAATPVPVPNAPVESEATTERVVVTGSYIPTAETESALPVTVYTAEVLKKQGANTPVEGLRQLPSFVGNALTENDSNGGNGTATINLRALGAENTLVLINGRRAFGFTNINVIPIGALSRTEILKDGASAVYGSDAVAGVVNFIMLSGPGEAPYEGAEIDVLYGNTTDTDAHVRQAYVRGGATGLDGKVSFAVAGEYYSRANLFSRDREIAVLADRTPLGGNNQGSPTFSGRANFRPDMATATDPFQPGGGNTFEDTFVLRNFTENDPSGVPTTREGNASYRVFDPPSGPAGGGTDPDRFNFRAFTPSIPGMEKWSYFVAGRYKIFGEGLQLYGDFIHSKQKQDNALAASPFALNTFEANQSPFNPFLNPIPDQAVDPTPNRDENPFKAGVQKGNETTLDNQLRSTAYRLVQELGNRESFYNFDNYRYVLGINGNFNIKDNDFINQLGYDTGILYERTDLTRTDSGDAKRSVIVDGINGLGGPTGPFFNPFIGQSAPVTGTATTYVNGVPTGTAAYDNQAVVDAAAFIARTFSYERDYLYDAKIFGNLFPGLYQGGVGFNVGYEHRQSEFEQFADPTQEAGDQLGFNAGARYNFRTEVDSFFGELRVPLILSTMNIPFARSLEIAFAYRYEEFENLDLFGKAAGVAAFDNGGTPRISIRYQPVADITMRASWGQSFLSPSAFQLFNPPAQNFPQLFDIFSNQTLQPGGGVFQEGTIGLVPEETDSYTAGIVYTPKWLPGFTMTVDFYQMFTRSLIVDAAETAQLLLTRNSLSLLAGDPAPGLDADPDGPGLGIFGGGPALGVTRAGTGIVQSIDSATTNAGKRLVQGMDVTAVYQIPTTNWGTFTTSVGYNYFFTWKAEALPGAGTHSFLGDYNNGTIPLAPGALPYHKGFLRGEWAWRGFDFVSTINYISSFNDDSAFVLAARPVGGTGSSPQYPFYRRVTDYITLDMQLSYEFKRPPAVEPTPTYAKDSKESKSPLTPAADDSSIWQRMLWGTTIRVGVNNAFDRQPPSVLGAFNDNYDTSLYSIRNRYYYIGLNKKF
jgi:iron complex outermembrane recepter protein